MIKFRITILVGYLIGQILYADPSLHASQVLYPDSVTNPRGLVVIHTDPIPGESFLLNVSYNGAQPGDVIYLMNNYDLFETVAGEGINCDPVRVGAPEIRCVVQPGAPTALTVVASIMPHVAVCEQFGRIHLQFFVVRPSASQPSKLNLAQWQQQTPCGPQPTSNNAS